MKHIDHGILLAKSDFSETSVVVRVLTREKGLQSFLAPGAKRKGKTGMWTMMPVELQYYQRNDSQLPKLTEWNVLFPCEQLMFDPVKSCLCFFMGEVTQQLIHQGQQDHGLFSFLLEELKWLQESNEFTNYPLWFVATCANHFGIAPETQHGEVFDFKKGGFTSVEPDYPFYAKGAFTEWCKKAISLDKVHFLALNIPKSERNAALKAWLDFLSHQISSMRPLKSLDVLKEVLS